jgi:hypothetical protein
MSEIGLFHNGASSLLRHHQQGWRQSKDEIESPAPREGNSVFNAIEPPRRDRRAGSSTPPPALLTIGILISRRHLRKV